MIKNNCIMHCLIRNKDPVLSYMSMRRVLLQANKEAYIGQKGWTLIITIVTGVVIGAVIGYLVGQSALGSASGATVGAGIMAVGLGLYALIPVEAWVDLAAFGQIAECCSSFAVLSLASIIMLGGYLFWHSLALALLAGVGVMTVLFVVLSIAARSYKDASVVQ